MAGYHPFLFTLIALLAITEIGFTAYFVGRFEDNNSWPGSERFRDLIILFLFSAAWTALFWLAFLWFIASGALHVLASIGTSLLWLLVTAILWVVAAALFIEEIENWECDRTPIVSVCRMAVTIMSIGWAEFGLCILTAFVSCCWVRSSRRRYDDPYYT